MEELGSDAYYPPTEQVNAGQEEVPQPKVWDDTERAIRTALAAGGGVVRGINGKWRAVKELDN